jgi:hypothetical protein
MVIVHGDPVNKFNLYAPAKALTEFEFTQLFQDTNDNDEVVQPLLTIDQIMSFNNNIEENQIINIINNYDFTQHHGGKYDFDHILDKDFQESCTMDTLSTISGSMSSDVSTSGSSDKAIEIFQGKTLNINSKLEYIQKD